MVQIDSVTLEHHREPLGIGENTPRISWKFTGNDSNWTQSSYEIEISRNISTAPQLFLVKSSDSILVPWPSVPLQSREEFTVRVRATGGSNQETTKWSSPVKAETGLLERKDWTAQMIASEKILTANDSLRPALFRKPFKLGSEVTSARLYITSHGVYEASINDSRVGDHVMAPGWTSYKYHLNYQTFDVTSHLKKGMNVIGAEVGEGWYGGRLGWGGGNRYIYGDQLGLLAQLEIELEDGTQMKIDSDKTWKTSTGPILASEIYDGEEYDANMEVPEWSTAEFDDESWSFVQGTDFPTSQLRTADGPPVRRTQILQVQEILRSPSGNVILDFGQNLVGGLRVRASGPKGHKIVFHHTEVLENGEVATRPLRTCKATDSLILGEKQVYWEPKFTFHGFRYVQVDNWPSHHGEPDSGDIQAVVIHTDMKQTGWFECSEPMVNQLHNNIRWGMRGNFVSIPTDCPQRDERLGWTGDIQVFSPTASFLYDTSGMLSGWLKDLAVEQIRDFDGVIPQVIPCIRPWELNRAQAAWADAGVIVPWDLYHAFGDINILVNQYESMKQWLGKGVVRQANGLWEPYGFQLGDWLDPDAPPAHPEDGKTDTHLVANAYLVHVTDLVAKVAKVLKIEDDISSYESDAARLKKLFQDEYMTPNGRLAPDTPTSIVLSIAFNLFATEQQVSNSTQRLSDLVRRSDYRIGTGFVGTPVMLPSLTQVGQVPLAYAMLLRTECPSWLYPITMGATTMWERWDSMLPDGSINPGEMTSFNHYALGSVGAWLHSIVGGISPAQPGWKCIRFEPIPGGTVTWAKIKYLSPYGEVKCEWKLEGKKFKMKATVPPNCTAEIKLPGKEDVALFGSGEHELISEFRAD